MVAVDEFKVINSDGLDYDDEFVKHKILDAIGDMMMAGRPLLASYTAYKSGHALNNTLVRALLFGPDRLRNRDLRGRGHAPPPAWPRWHPHGDPCR